MNRLTTILGTAAALCLLAACTGADDAPVADGPASAAQTLATDVPISLGVKADAGVTRAGGTGALDKFDNTTVGLFCIATRSIADAAVAPSWDGGATGDAYNATLWWNNLAGTIAADGTLPMDGMLAKDDARRYYPHSPYAYAFYAYHPHTSDITVTDDEVTAHYQLDGTDDVLWAEASSDDAHAYSASYFRNDSAQQPQLAFSHKLIRLHFLLAATGDAATTSVTSVTVKGLPAEATLVVASKEKDRQGALLPDWTKTKDYVKQYEDSVAPTFASQQTDLGIDLIVPMPTEASPYKVALTYKTDKTWTWEAILITPSEGWQMGTTYNIALPLKQTNNE